MFLFWSSPKCRGDLVASNQSRQAFESFYCLNIHIRQLEKWILRNIDMESVFHFMLFEKQYHNIFGGTVVLPERWWNLSWFKSVRRSILLICGEFACREAKQRSTSIYLPTETIPMFPMELATSIFSLRQGHECCAISISVIFRPDGRWFSFLTFICLCFVYSFWNCCRSPISTMEINVWELKVIMCSPYSRLELVFIGMCICMCTYM